MSAVRFPSWNAGREMLVGIGDAPVMFFLKGIFTQLRLGISQVPKMFYELIALFVGAELQVSGALCGGNNVRHIVVQPIALIVGQFSACLFFLFFLRFAAFGFKLPITRPSFLLPPPPLKNNPI